MTLEEAEARIKALEDRVRWLEARPVYVPWWPPVIWSQPYYIPPPVPYYQPGPFVTPSTFELTCSSNAIVTQ